MIEFPCRDCGQKLKVEEKHAGKRIKCPKCGSVGVVPDNSDKIKFHCENCGQSISVPQIHAGKTGKCPKCKTPIVVPSPMSERAGVAPSDPAIPSGADEDLYEDESDLPEEGEGMDRRLILVIGGAAAVVVVGLIILVAVILPSGSQPTEPIVQEPPREDVAPKEPAQSSAAASDDTRNLDLKLRLKPGRKHKLRIVREENTSQTVGEQPQNTNRTKTTELGFEVEQVEPNGVARLKVTYLAIHEIMKIASRQIEYDSAKPDTAARYPFGSILSAMIGQSFVAKVTPEGEIVELEGLAEMYRRMAEPVVDSEDERIRQRMVRKRTERPEEDARRAIDKENRKYGSREKRIEGARGKLEKGPYAGEKDIREMLGHVIMPLPGEPVGIGDSWQAWTALFSISSVGLDDCTYTLRESRQTAILVDISSKIELADELVFGEDGLPGSARATLAGSCEGSVEIDPSSGWMLRKNVTMRCSGEVKMALTEQTPQGTTQPVSMEIVTTVKPIE